ncbi:hypothetical protein [Halomonas elongata]|uniref:hypothetical protein n=1 Tax=Halomonas elongata TaxID=2746 RepID=UPI00186B9FFB|nr:hypothetical protein [Halomonas elongata]MBW5802050.1 hypothetical protein [Halomonas elongata]
MKKYLALPVLIALSGCAPSTVLELQNDSVQLDFSVAESYQQVFKDVRTELNRCMFGGALMAKTNIDAQLYPDLGEGEISVRYNNMGDRSVFLHVEIKEDGSATDVTTYSSTFGKWDAAGERVRRYAQNDVPMC